MWATIFSPLVQPETELPALETVGSTLKKLQRASQSQRVTDWAKPVSPVEGELELIQGPGWETGWVGWKQG